MLPCSLHDVEQPVENKAAYGKYLRLIQTALSYEVLSVNQNRRTDSVRAVFKDLQKCSRRSLSEIVLSWKFLS